jgi:opacity protein-like surface antigen
MKYFPLLNLFHIAFFSLLNLYSADLESLPTRKLFDDESLNLNLADNKNKKLASTSSLFDSEFTELRKKHLQQSSPKPEQLKPTTPQPKASSTNDKAPNPQNPNTTAVNSDKAKATTTINKPIPKPTKPSQAKPRLAPSSTRSPAYDPKDLRNPNYLRQEAPVIIKEDIREGRIYVTAGIGGVLGSTNPSNIARVDNDAFQKASAAAYKGNSLTARFGRVDSDIAVVGMVGVGYDSSISNRSLGYSIGLEYLYQDKTLKQQYSTHDAFGNRVSGGELELGETHYIMAKILGKYRIDSWLPYIGIGGGMAIYNIRDHLSTDLHAPIFGNSTHTTPVIMFATGLEYDFNQDWSITGEYKYLYCPTATLNKELKSEFKSFDSHNLMIGAKYGF